MKSTVNEALTTEQRKTLEQTIRVLKGDKDVIEASIVKVALRLHDKDNMHGYDAIISKLSNYRRQLESIDAKLDGIRLTLSILNISVEA